MKLYWTASPPRAPLWGAFLSEGVHEALALPEGRSASAIALVRIESQSRQHYFAFTFGPSGRFFLRDDVYYRAYGLKTALNLMYPAGGAANRGEGLRTVASKRRSATVVRARTQASSVTTFDVFDVDRLRDLVDGVEGRPVDTDKWGRTVGGADSISITHETEFAELGSLCREIDRIADRTDYREQFAWLDYIQPVTDPVLTERLHDHALESIRSGDGDLELAPPEIIDWSRVHRFEFPFDRRRGLAHQDLRLADLRTTLQREGKLDELDYRSLRQRRISASNVDGDQTYRWTIWSCLTGELNFDGHTYVIDEGDFFEVQPDYLASLNDWTDELPRSGLELPPCDLATPEDAYNKEAARVAGCLLLDRRNVQRRGATAVEICDLLAAEGALIHVKKNSGSSDLSHLFSQGVVSASVLQEDSEFRALAAEKVRGIQGGEEFGLFGEPWVTSQVEIVFAIIDRRWPTAPSAVLPFFSKVNLRRSVRDLESRGYGVTLLPVSVRV